MKKTYKELEKEIKNLENTVKNYKVILAETINYIDKMSECAKSVWQDYKLSPAEARSKRKLLLSQAKMSAVALGLYNNTNCSELESAIDMLAIYEIDWQKKCKNYARGIFAVRLESGLVIIGSSKRFEKRKRDIERKYGESITDEYIGKRVEDFPTMVANLNKHFALNNYNRGFFKPDFSDVVTAIDREYQCVDAKNVLETLQNF